MPQAPQIEGAPIRFADFELDVRAGELHQGDRNIRLQEQCFQILLLLLAHPGEVVTRDELRAKLWPDGTIVDFEHSVNAAIKRLREALGDSADNPRFVETIPRRGYRFLVEVNGKHDTPDTPGRSTPAAFRSWAARRWKSLAALSVVVLVLAAVAVFSYLRRAPAPTRLSVAVLPLKNMSGDAQQDYFTDGITEDIISHLADLPELKVISHTSVQQYKNTTKTVKQITSELGVDTILEGSVRREGKRMRLVAQLIDARKDEHLWAQTYDRELSDIFAVQSEVATQIATALNTTVTAPLKEKLERRPTTNVEAYDLFLRARQATQAGYTDAHLRTEIRLLEDSLKLDPKFALAHVFLAESHAAMWFNQFERDPRHITLARASAERALALQPDLPEARRALGIYYYMCELDYPRALQEFELARRAKPGDADAVTYIGWVQRRQGKMQEALANQLRGLELDPRDARNILDIGATYALLRNFEDASRFFDRAIALQPDYAEAYGYQITIRYRLRNDPAGAREYYHRAQSLGLGTDSGLLYPAIALETHAGNYAGALELLSASREDSYARRLLSAQLREFMGERELARTEYQAARTVLEKLVQSDPSDSRYHSALGLALACLGEKDSAIREGLKAVEIMPIDKDAWRGAYRLEDLARIYVRTGEREKAIHILEQLMSISTDLGAAALRGDPSWKSLRAHPAFQELLRRYPAN